MKILFFSVVLACVWLNGKPRGNYLHVGTRYLVIITARLITIKQGWRPKSGSVLRVPCLRRFHFRPPIDFDLERLLASGFAYKEEDEQT